MKTKLTVIVVILSIVACTPALHLQPQDADLAIARQKIPGITMTDLQSGYKIYTVKCSACHRLHKPEEYMANQWKPILSKMFGKAKMSDETQKQLVTNFLIAKSK